MSTAIRIKQKWSLVFIKPKQNRIIRNTEIPDSFISNECNTTSQINNNRPQTYSEYLIDYEYYLYCFYLLGETRILIDEVNRIRRM